MADKSCTPLHPIPVQSYLCGVRLHASNSCFREAGGLSQSKIRGREVLRFRCVRIILHPQYWDNGKKTDVYIGGIFGLNGLLGLL